MKNLLVCLMLAIFTIGDYAYQVYDYREDGKAARVGIMNLKSRENTVAVMYLEKDSEYVYHLYGKTDENFFPYMQWKKIKRNGILYQIQKSIFNTI